MCDCLSKYPPLFTYIFRLVKYLTNCLLCYRNICTVMWKFLRGVLITDAEYEIVILKRASDLREHSKKLTASITFKLTFREI